MRIVTYWKLDIKKIHLAVVDNYYVYYTVIYLSVIS